MGFIPNKKQSEDILSFKNVLKLVNIVTRSATLYVIAKVRNEKYY